MMNNSAIDLPDVKTFYLTNVFPLYLLCQYHVSKSFAKGELLGNAPLTLFLCTLCCGQSESIHMDGQLLFIIHFSMPSRDLLNKF